MKLLLPSFMVMLIKDMKLFWMLKHKNKKNFTHCTLKLWNKLPFSIKKLLKSEFKVEIYTIFGKQN